MEVKNQVLLSIVVVTMNNLEELTRTLSSIEAHCIESCQVAVVNSGIAAPVNSLLEKHRSSSIHTYEYFYQSPMGVFPAQNYGISQCRGQWIMVLNSGDELAKNASEILLTSYLAENNQFDVLVFSQITMRDNRPAYRFVPAESTIWPHQSILVRQDVYKRFGMYREDFRYAAEQYYFARIRRHIKFKLVDRDLTMYSLGGLSSNVNYRFSRELFAIWRRLGAGKLSAFQKSYILPYFRCILLRVLPVSFVEQIRMKTYNRYKKIAPTREV
ncbi:MAG TPA: glycosyltransferase [Chitinophagaceae bacterium]